MEDCSVDIEEQAEPPDAFSRGDGSETGFQLVHALKRKDIYIYISI